MDEITITLTNDEAITLALICAWIGGSPFKSRRVHSDRIAEKLKDQGYQYAQELRQAIEFGSGIMFKDYA